MALGNAHTNGLTYLLVAAVRLLTSWTSGKKNPESLSCSTKSQTLESLMTADTGRTRHVLQC